ncbi:MAG: TIGR00725 family protein [Candidatus Tectomicrobia bacterium]|nr:TIGR00725 family protein [Candidatus Tectomicrobia bacterium]
MKTLIAVIGDSAPSAETAALAEEVGRLLAREGAVLVCGGLGGVMEAAARGAKSAGGLTIGILPGYDPASANPHIDLPVCTGMGHARNAVIAATAGALIALEGSYGTLSEIALGLKLGRRVVGLGRRESPPGVLPARNPEEAVRRALHG